jgi:hypothetical protein
MKALHHRRSPYRPRLEFAIGILGLAVCGLGIGLVTADVLEERPVPISTQEPTTTTIMINSAVIEPETTTTVAPTTTTTMPRPVGRVPAPMPEKAVASVAAPSSTTTTTQSPKTPLEVALKYLGQTGPWADGGFYCAKAVSYFAEEAQVEGVVARDGPSALYADAVADGRFTETPAVGDMIFIDLFGPGGIGHGQVTHVGIVETVEGLTEGSTIAIVQGNGAPDPSVITRTTYHLGDGYIVGFAPFARAA